MFSGNSIIVGSRDFSSFFILRIWRQSFLLTNLTMVISFSFKQWQACTFYLTISTPVFLKTPHNISSRTLLSTELGLPTISRVPCLECWVFSQHCLSVLASPSIGLLLIVLTTEIPASNFFKWVGISLTVFDRSAICEPFSLQK